ncbi:MAG: PLP-dependent transferase [Anaerolineae bacterium]|nr:PLP-dependent transferase [Anaerolineae bacterium]
MYVADVSIDTLVVHAGEKADPTTGALTPPIHMSAAFELPEFGPQLFDALMMESHQPPYAYTRWGHPTGRVLEEKMAALEGGAAALALASGMAAVSALLFTFLSSGDHVVASEVCYAGSVELFGEYLPRQGVAVSLVDTGDVDAVQAALRPTTRVVYVETPANPILRIADIAALAEIAHAAGALLAVDSTWAGPCLQRPLALGADYVLHSATKYLNGHGDALGGVIVGPAEGIQRIRKEALVHLGGAISPFNAWLIARGLVTLPLRMARHSEGALTVARFLADHPAVTQVTYPGLESHPHHALACRQMSAFGGMLTFQLRHGLGAAITLAEKIRLFTYATSLGHARSLLFYYPTDLYVDAVSYLSDAQKHRIREWMGEGIVRVSVGLESAQDLIADLDQALRARTVKGMVGPAAYAVLKRLQGGSARA